MPLTLPNLDDLSWEQLVREGRSLIPAYAPEWTNHNAADPGITLIELFAYLSEILIYRLNLISENNFREFLKLINGPEWEHSKDLRHELQQEKRRIVSNLRHLHRAVTAPDFEAMALAVNTELAPDASEHVMQTKCLPGMNLAEPGVPYENAAAPGHLSVIVLSDDREEPSEELRRQISTALESARLLTTWVHVVAPRYVTVAVRVKIAVEDGADAEAVRTSAMESLTRYFDPHRGGPQGKGWPFGRGVFVSDIYALLARLPGVAFVTKPVDTLTGQSLDEVVIDASLAARQVRNHKGELEAITLQPNELVKLRIDRNHIAMVRGDGEPVRNRREP
ncbi:MAG: baseplate J/gp47 family protein [Acidobacteriia bacterium]|nr:baseplate J/gp47 family protein [Terriglobia bacterium]